MSDTLPRLAKETVLSRDQANLIPHDLHDPGMLRIEIRGIRSGDRVICGSESFERVLGALIGPMEVVDEALSGYNPLSSTSADSRILVKPRAHGSGKYPAGDSKTAMIQCGPDDVFAMLPDGNLDCVIIDGIDYKPSPSDSSSEISKAGALFSGSDVTMPLFREALRLSRKRVVLICECADPLSGDAPETKGFIRQRGDCTANWYPVDFTKHIIVLGGSVSKNEVEVFSRFGVIIDVPAESRESIADFRLVVVSEVAANFEWRSNDIVLCDVDIVDKVAQFSSMYRSMTMVPLKQLRSVITTPQDVLRSSILNFGVLENYMRTLPTVVAQGTDAKFVVADMKAILASSAS